MNLGVRAKFLLVMISIVVVADLAAGLYLQWRLRAREEQRVEVELAHHARAARDLLVFGLERGSLQSTSASLDPVADQVGRSVDARVTIIEADGRVLGDSELSLAEIAVVENHGDRPEILRAGTSDCGLAQRHSTTIKTDMLYCALAYEADMGDGARAGVVRVSTPLAAVDDTIARMRVILAVGGLLSLALTIVAGAIASRLMYLRVRELVDAARALAEGDRERSWPIPASDEFGGLAGSLKRVADELERTVKELASERDLFETVIHSMDEAVLAVDREHRVISSNRSAKRLLSLADDVRGRLLLEVARLPQLMELVDHAARGEVRSIDITLESGPSPRHLMVRATPRGETGGAVLVMHDVTEIRRLETVRRDFVANVSHELRTPISVIQANTETLLSGALDEPALARRFLDAISRNAQRLGLLISDLLDISRIEAGKYKTEMRALSMLSVGLAVENATTEACKAREVDLVLDIDPELEVHADPGALQQILVNLVENAIKYGPVGGRVELAAVEQGAMVRIEVRDQGPGIAPEQRRRVFERFYRVDPGRSRHMGGTGLGLAIVKNLTEVMGGDVGVDPREPHGSCFWVRLGKAGSDAETQPPTTR